MQRCVLIIACVGFTAWYGHTQTPDWIGPFGGYGEDVVRKLHVNPDGNSFTTGYFTDQSDIGLGKTTPQLNANGYFDAFIQKNATYGHTLWAQGFGSQQGFEYGTAITTDPSGNVYATGVFDQPVDVDPGAGEVILTPAGAQDIYLVKYSPTGEFVWGKSIGGSAYEETTGIGCDENGNLYVAGYFYELTDFDPGTDTFNLASNGLGDGFIAKYSPNGDLQWVYSLGNTETDLIQNLKVTPNGTIYVVGTFSNGVDFDPGPDSYFISAGPTGKAAFYLVLDAEGSFIRAGHFAGAAINNDIDLDAEENLYVAGYFHGTIDFDPGAGTTEYYSPQDRGYIVKLLPDGAFQWVYVPEADEAVIGYSVDASVTGNITLSGYIENQTDFNPAGEPFVLGVQPENAAMSFIAVVHAENGAFIHAAVFGGANFMDYHGAYSDATGALYASGTFETQSDLNPDAFGTDVFTSSGYRDSYVLRIPPVSVGLSEQTLHELLVYPNPANEMLFLELPADLPVNGFLTDASGRTLKTWNTTHLQAIDLSTFSAGCYLLHLSGYNILTIFKQ